MDEPDEQEPERAPVVITASGLGVDGEHGPLFSGIDLELTSGLHAIQLPGGPGQDALLLTLAGRFKPTHGTLTVLGDTKPRAIRRHCSIAAFPDIDELEESVTVQTVLAEQPGGWRRGTRAIPQRGRPGRADDVFGETPAAKATGTYIVELSDLELFLLRITLATLSNRPILVVGDLEQVRDNARRAIAVDRLGAIATQRTVVVGVTNPLGERRARSTNYTITAS